MTSSPRWLTVGGILFRAALLLWPRKMRAQLGKPMLAAFIDSCQDAHRRGGAMATVARATSCIADAARSGVAARFDLAGRSAKTSTPPLTRPRSPGATEKMLNLFADFRFAFRSLRRQPTFAAVAIATLAVAIGANTIIFSIVKGVLLDPLPYADPARLVSLNSDHEENGLDGVSAADLVDWREGSELVEDIAGFMYWGYTYTDGEEPLDVPSVRVSPSLFRILGVDAEIGRTFTDAEEFAGSEPVVVLSHSLWMQEFSGDESIVGERLVLDGAPHTVVGVMGSNFDFPPQSETGLWTSVQWNPETLRARRGQRNVSVIAKLKSGVTLLQAEEELDAVAAKLAADFPDTNGQFGVAARSAHSTLVVGATGANAIVLLFAAVGFLLLIACANVTNLMLARLTARDREISVRTALGAGRLHLARQFLSETLLLAGAGGLLGFLLATWGVRQVRSIDQVPLDRLRLLEVDGGVLAFCFGVSLSVGVVFGLLPAWRATRPRFADALTDGGTAGLSRGRRVLKTLVVAEVALSMILVIGAGLMTRTFSELMAIDPGFRSDNLLAANVFIPDTLYAEDHEIARFFSETVDAIETIPGVVSAGAVTSLPMDYIGIDFSLPYTIVGAEPLAGGPPRAQYRVATPGYFDTIAVPLLRGRMLEATDRVDAPRVMLVNETLARREFPDEDPIGKSLQIPIGGDHEIVGVVRDLRHYGLGQDAAPEMYIAMEQNPFSGMVIVTRTASSPGDFVEPIKQAILSVDPRQPVYEFNTMDQLVSANVALPRLNMLMSSAFGLVALVLAAVGIFGVMSYVVSQSTREIGVRMALGADAREAATAVVGSALFLAGVGIVLGLLGAAGVSQFLRNQLFGVGAIDPVVFGAVAVLFLLIAGLASYLPARRATRIDPLIALRAESD